MVSDKVLIGSFPERQLLCFLVSYLVVESKSLLEIKTKDSIEMIQNMLPAVTLKTVVVSLFVLTS